MSSENLKKVNTKLKAMKLIYDPVILLNLIYSKYGDIEEDFNLLYINQLVYDKSSRYNIHFKEYQCLNNGEEFLKRFYQKYESRPRIPKLSEYYKNYHLFFCRPNFKDFVISDIMENYGDDKAEVFYKNNYEKSNSNNEQSEKHNSESLSSLDNITDNKIIFTKKTKKIIDHNLDNNFGTLTLTLNSIKSNLNNDKNNTNNNDGLISMSSSNNSFEKMVHNLIYYEKNKIKYEKNKKTLLNKPIKKNILSGKKFNNKVGGMYASKKINKNIIYSLNISNAPMNSNNDKIIQNLRNKNSLFSLLKSKNLINITKTESNINKSKKHNNVSLNLNKSQNKNKISNGNIFCSPKNIKEQHLASKFEQFHTNVIKPNTSFHHKRNKTVYFNQQISGINTNPSNTLNNHYLNTLSNILSKNNIKSRNYIENFKNINNKQTIFNNYLTINNNNNLVNKQRGFNEMKNRIKNKTFEIENIKNNLMNKLVTLKESLKIYQKNNINRQNYKNNHIDINNQVIIKKNNILGSNSSKFSLIKNNLKINNNKFCLNKNIKKSLKLINPKLSPLIGFNKNIISSNKSIGFHKKSQTSIISNIIESSSKNHINSPTSVVKPQNKIHTINKSESISSKMRPKIANHKINNLNINFNNVIFNAPLSNINQNINYNSHYITNTNENLNYKLLTPTNNHNIFSSTFSNHKNNNSHVTNNNINKEPLNEKLSLITNLKNFCNFSRNKINLFGKSFSQNDDNHSLIKNNKNGKTVNEKNKIYNNTYSNLYMNEKNDIFKKKKIDLIIPKPTNKKVILKNSKKSSNKPKKTKKKIEGRNKKFENDVKNFMTENSKDINGNESLKITYDLRNINNNKLYFSPKTTGRINTIQPINVNRNTNLMSKKIIKTKQKIKLK